MSQAISLKAAVPRDLQLNQDGGKNGTKKPLIRDQSVADLVKARFADNPKAPKPEKHPRHFTFSENHKVKSQIARYRIDAFEYKHNSAEWLKNEQEKIKKNQSGPVPTIDNVYKLRNNIERQQTLDAREVLIDRLKEALVAFQSQNGTLVPGPKAEEKKGEDSLDSLNMQDFSLDLSDDEGFSPMSKELSRPFLFSSFQDESVV